MAFKALLGAFGANGKRVSVLASLRARAMPCAYLGILGRVRMGWDGMICNCSNARFLTTTSLLLYCCHCLLLYYLCLSYNEALGQSCRFTSVCLLSASSQAKQSYPRKPKSRSSPTNYTCWCLTEKICMTGDKMCDITWCHVACSSFCCLLVNGL